MKSKLLLFLGLFLLPFLNARSQTLAFDNLTGNGGTSKSISWTTSIFGNGFGHRIVNNDPGGHTTLNFQARHNTVFWSDVMVLTSTGSVGIGVSNPSNDQGWGRVMEIKHNDHSKILVSAEINSVRLGLYAHSNWNGPRGLIGTESVHDLSIVTGYSREAIRVKTNGNVGIGTVSPTHKLEVNGTIKTKEVNVTTTGWADYVFDPGYKLMPLSEVEAFVQKNGHLPNMPSEKEVLEGQGVNLMEMNVKLLEKIEELTLYIIDQQKIIEQLKRKIE